MATSDETDPRFRIWVDDPDRIIRCTWAAGAEVTLDAAVALTSRVAAITAAGPGPLLVDLRGITNLTRDARTYFVTESGGATAVALLTESAVSRMIANFFIGASRTAYPVKTFTSEEDAADWLRKI